MNLIIGGAYQGKLDCAKKKYNLTDDDIFVCDEDSNISYDRKCINKAEEFTLYCVHNNLNAEAIFAEHKDEWKDSVIICQDIFCGVVPLGADMRAWREMTGRLCAYLSREADSVTRVFCGLEQKLK